MDDVQKVWSLKMKLDVKLVNGERVAIIPLGQQGLWGKRTCAECRKFKRATYWTEGGWYGRRTRFFCQHCGEALFTMQELAAITEAQ